MSHMIFKTALIICVMLVMLIPHTSSAHTSCTSTVPCRTMSITQTTQSINDINGHVDNEFQAHRVWWISIFWEDNILPALMLMAEQLTTVAVKQTEIVGGFMDAKHQMETQQVLQKISARAHKDYQPSTGMCEFGSTMKSLATSERQGEVGAVIMAQRSMDRALGNANTAASAGKLEDSRSRLKQFREVYCNLKDNNNGLQFMCDHDQNPSTSGPAGGADPKRYNKDIDFARTIDAPWTLDVNLVDGASTSTPDEDDVFAMAANLYGREVLPRPKGVDLVTSAATSRTLTPLQHAYMDARSVLAKRSVAENSYNAIVGMKSAGTAGSRDYLEAILLELGIEDASSDVATQAGNVSALDALLGENPSYFAQMEVLTKKIYQNPDFYTNLYDKPANVARKGVAIQAITLMQKFDMLKSNLREEANDSILLELEVIKLQDEIESLDVSTLGGR